MFNFLDEHVFRRCLYVICRTLGYREEKPTNDLIFDMLLVEPDVFKSNSNVNAIKVINNYRPKGKSNHRNIRFIHSRIKHTIFSTVLLLSSLD